MRPSPELVVHELVSWDCDNVDFVHPTAENTPKHSTCVIGKRIYFC